MKTEKALPLSSLHVAPAAALVVKPVFPSNNKLSTSGTPEHIKVSTTVQDPANWDEAWFANYE